MWVRIAAGNHRIARIELPLVAKRWYENQFFEATKQFTYVLRSCKMRSKAIKALQGGPQVWIYLFAKLPLSLALRNLRFFVHKLKNRKICHYGESNCEKRKKY